MRKLALAIALAGVLSNVHASGDAFALDGVANGIVESLHPVVVSNLFEHALKPETADELVIRVDDGRAVVLRQEAMQRFVPGQRVRLVSSTTGLRVEHE
jgi:outer membrane lipoprotein SlyB